MLFSSGPRSIHRTHLNFKAVRSALSAGINPAELEVLFDVKAAVIKWTQGLYQITDDGVFYDGERLPACIERRVLAFMDEGLPFEPLLKFHERLKANPSRRAVQELYTFLEHKNIPIGSDGYFFAYKSVRADWMDHHSGKFFNGVGQTLSMPRNAVDDDCYRHCSYGFHAGSLQYASTFGGPGSRLLIVKIDPADVVSIPTDYECQKLRTCKYEVVAQYTGPLPETTWSPTEEEDFGETWEDESGCPECGSELEDEWVACPHCGYVFL